MNSSPKPFFFATILFAILCPGILQANETATVRFYAPPLRGILTEDSVWDRLPSRMRVGEGADAQSVSLYRNGYSRAIQVPKGVPLPLFIPVSQEKDSREKDLEDAYKSIGELTPIPADWDRVLVILPSGIPEDAASLSHELLDFSESTVPVGAHTFQNNLENPVEIRIDGKVFNVAPGKRAARESETNSLRVLVIEIDGTRSRRFTGAVHGKPSQGTLHLIRKNPGSMRRIDFLSLSMEAPVPEETVKAEDDGDATW